MSRGSLLIFLLAMACLMGLGILGNGSAAYYSDSETSNDGGLTAWNSTQWTQTSQADFGAGVLTNVSIVLNPDNVILRPGASGTTPNLFLFWDGVGAVPTGWTDVSVSGQAFNNRFPRGAATYGGTGGAATHTHTRALVTGGPPLATTPVLSGSTNLSSTTHTHALSTGSTAAGSSLPVYHDLRVIRYTGKPATIPAGAIAIFDGTLPSGWTQYSAQDNYFVRGADVAGATGGSNTHNHTFTGTLNASTSYQTASTATPNTTVAARNHTHTVSGATPDGDGRPPYITVILAKADSDTPIPYGMIAMFSAAPGAGWTSLSASGGAFNSMFIVGGSSYGTTGGAATHTHTNATATSANSTTTGTAATTSPNVTVAANGHNHSITVSFGTPANTLPPYVNVIVAKAGYPTSGTNTFASQVLDTTVTSSRWDALFWDKTLPANTNITLAVRASNTSFLKDAANPTWTSVGGTSPVLTGLPAGRYKQWRATLTTTDLANTPVLSEVRIYYFGP